MSYFNNEPSYVNGDNSISGQDFRTSLDSNQVDVISSSNLRPTSAEFHPLSSTNGAIRKEPQRHLYNRQKGSRNSSYGSGRTFSNSRSQKQFYERQEHEQVFVREDYNHRSQQKEPSENTFENSNGFSRLNGQSPKSSYNNTMSNSSYQSSNRNYHDGSSSSYNSYHKNNSYDNYRKENHRDFNDHGNSYKRFGNKNDQPNRSFNYNSNRFKKDYNNYGRKKSSYNRFNDVKVSSDVLPSSSREQDHFQENYKTEESDNHQPNSSYKSTFNNNYNGNKFSRRNFRDSGMYTPFFKTRTEKNSTQTNKVDAASQKERLEEMIYNRILECLVCCEKIKNNEKIWSCQLCYHILHLHCIIAWVKSSKIEKGWRCPACQNVYQEVPSEYKCYCGKNTEPKPSPSIIAHGCGDVCLRKGRMCDHKCTLLCHPGPCPDCTIMVSKTCGCGATNSVIKCSAGVEIVCENICNKTLECGIHRCSKICHFGDCELCTEIVHQECYCGKVGRKVSCTSENSGKSNYECGEICGKQLSCGNHTCQKVCHEGPCQTCIRDVNQVSTCPCGKTRLEKTRDSCLDPISCCDKICGKQLKCGQPGFRHTCNNKCHEGECPSCPLTTVVRCRCGHMDKELPCQKLTTNPDDTRCEKKCTRKRLCGKHKCNQRCCIEVEHICPLPCNHVLSCGQHRCERTCHSGRCPPCMETSFEELFCECGASVLYPPIPCGTKPPACSKPCSRPRTCEHDVNHNCHTGSCPPCTVLCKKWCYGHHEQRSAIFCHQDNFSCGLPCGKDMSCGRHKCIKPCHNGPCPTVCNQPCTTKRRLCGHICGKPCHNPPCPESGCKQRVPVTCTCGLQKSTRLCIEVDEEFKNIEMAQLKEKIGVSSKDHTVDISDIVGNTLKPSVLKILECNEECRVLERNRRLAIGLQIVNPDLSQKLTPKYSDFMRQWARKDINFCQRIHDKLTDLVQLAKQSKQKSRSYSFESMNKDKRHFIHEYCEHFGIETAAYDREPNRNVVATAVKDKSWLPSMSLMEVIQRENGQRKVPGPISVSTKSIVGKSETVSLKLPSRVQRPVSPPNVDANNHYFDLSK